MKKAPPLQNREYLKNYVFFRTIFEKYPLESDMKILNK